MNSQGKRRSQGGNPQAGKSLPAPIFQGKATRGEGGFTIVEVIIAIAVLAIGALAFVSAHVASSTLEKTNRETAMAVNEARRVIEEIKQLPFAEISEDNIAPYFDVVQGGETLTTLPGEYQCGSVSISPEDADGMKEILVTVRWRAISGGERNIQLACQVCDHL